MTIPNLPFHPDSFKQTDKRKEVFVATMVPVKGNKGKNVPESYIDNAIDASPLEKTLSMPFVI